MGEKSKIEWCDSTWNPVTGCLHTCEYCYARSMATRFGAGMKAEGFPELDQPMKGRRKRAEPYPYGFTPTLHKFRLDQPTKWREGRKIFVCSMADLFGEWVPDRWIEEVFASCAVAPQHKYLFLTKNPRRYIELEEAGLLPHKDNMWFGSSITTKHDVYAWMDKTVTSHYFLSVEPILAPLGEMNGEAEKPGWVIIGAETGHRADKVVPERWWIEELVGECRKYGIPVFMKSSLAEIWGEQLIQEWPEGLGA